MARINLLPWREGLRAQKKREFFVAMGGTAFLMVGVVFYVHMHISGMIDYQNSRNNFLRQEIKQVEAKIKEIQEIEKQKQQLIARMRIIERLQGNRPEVVHLFDELARIIPEGLYLTNLKQSGKNLTLEGLAQSNARVSNLMRNLDNSPWFERPVLDIIQASSKGGERSRSFKLRVTQAIGQSEDK